MEVASDVLQRLDVVTLFGLEPVARADDDAKDIVDALEAFVDHLRRWTKSSSSSSSSSSSAAAFGDCVEPFEGLLEWEKELKPILKMNPDSANRELQRLMSTLKDKIDHLWSSPGKKVGDFFLIRVVFSNEQLEQPTSLIYRFTKTNAPSPGVTLAVISCGNGPIECFPPDLTLYPVIRRCVVTTVICTEKEKLLDDHIIWGLLAGFFVESEFNSVEHLYECTLSSLGAIVYDPEIVDVDPEVVHKGDTFFHPILYLLRQISREKERKLKTIPEKDFDITDALRRFYQTEELEKCVVDPVWQDRYYQCFPVSNSANGRGRAGSPKHSVIRSDIYTPTLDDEGASILGESINADPAYATVRITPFGPSSLLEGVTQSMDHFGGADFQAGGDHDFVNFQRATPFDGKKKGAGGAAAAADNGQEGAWHACFSVLADMASVVSELLDKSASSPWQIIALQICSHIERRMCELPLVAETWGAFPHHSRRVMFLELLHTICLTYCRCVYSLGGLHGMEQTANRVLCVGSMLAIVDIVIQAPCTDMPVWKLATVHKTLPISLNSWKDVGVETLLQYALICSPLMAKQREKFLSFCERARTKAKSDGSTLFGWRVIAGEEIKFEKGRDDETMQWVSRLREAYGLQNERAPVPRWLQDEDYVRPKFVSPEEQNAEWLGAEWTQEKSVRVLLDIQVCFKFTCEMTPPDIEFGEPFFVRISVDEGSTKQLAEIIISVSEDSDECDEAPLTNVNALLAQLLKQANEDAHGSEDEDEDDEAYAGGADANLVTEETILMKQCVPLFGGALSAEDAEHLLSILTAPYCSIPSLFQWLSTRGGILLNTDIRDLVFRALFEPGLFAEKPVAPSVVPAQRSDLRTPMGRLEFDTHTFSETILRPLRRFAGELLRLAKHAGNPLETPFGPLLMTVIRWIVYIVRFSGLSSQNPCEQKAMDEMRDWIVHGAIPLVLEWIHRTEKEPPQDESTDRIPFLFSFHAHLGLLGASVMEYKGISKGEGDGDDADDADADAGDDDQTIPDGVRLIALCTTKVWSLLPSVDTYVEEDELGGLIAAKELALTLELERPRICEMITRAWEVGGLLKADVYLLFNQCNALQGPSYSIVDVRNPSVRIAALDWSVARSGALTSHMTYCTPREELEPYWQVEKKIEFPDAPYLELSFCEGTYLGEDGSVTLYKDSSRTEYWGEKDMCGHS